MPIVHKIDQRSDDWDSVKKGVPSSSCFDRIITPQSKPSKQWQQYAYHLLAERLLDRRVNTYTSEWMEYGIEQEADAVAFYEMVKGVKTDYVGFITDDKARWGCSPDRLIGDEGLLECKCPKPATHIEYLLTGKIDKKYMPQLQGQLFVSERQWVDIISYHPEMPPSIIRVERNDVYIKCMEELLIQFDDFMTKVVDKIKAVQESQINKEELNVAQMGY